MIDQRMIGQRITGRRRRRNGPRFAVEALFRVGILRQMRGQNFYRDIAIEPRVPRPIHFPHAARAQRRDNFIRPKFGPRGQRHKVSGINYMRAIIECPHAAEMEAIRRVTSRKSMAADA